MRIRSTPAVKCWEGSLNHNLKLDRHPESVSEGGERLKRGKWGLTLP